MSSVGVLSLKSYLYFIWTQMDTIFKPCNAYFMVTFNPVGHTLPELDDWHLETQLLFSCLHFGGCKKWVVPVLFKSHEDSLSILEALLKLLVRYLVNDATFRQTWARQVSELSSLASFKQSWSKAPGESSPPIWGCPHGGVAIGG